MIGLRFFTKDKLIFLLLVAWAFSLRSIYFNQTVGFIQPGSGSDSQFYFQWAESIVRGNLLGSGVFYALPVYPYFLSLAYAFSGGEIFGLILIQIFIGAINCGLIYLLAKRLFNHQVGIIASIIACGYSMFIFYDRMILPTSLAIFLGLLLALLLLKVRDRPSAKRWFGVGLLFALCTLVRASFSLLGLFIPFWIAYEYRRRKPLGQLLLYCCSFILPCVLLMGAVTLRNYLVARDPVFITAHSGINFYIGNNPKADGLFKPPAFIRPTQSGLVEDARIIAQKIGGRRLRESEVSNFWLKQALNFIKSQPLNYVRLLGKKFALFWNGTEFVDEIEYYIFREESGLFKLPLFRFSLICPLGLLGIFLSWPKRSRIMPLYLFIFSLMLATVSFFINSRYRLIVVPYLIIFAAFALWQSLEMCKSRKYKSLIYRIVLFFALFFLINVEITKAGTQLNFTFHYNKGIYLKDRADFQKAQEEFQAALALNPLDYMSYLGLGNVYHEMHDFPQAINNYQRSLQINPYFYKPYFNLGLIYEEMGDKEKAEEQFKKVLKLLPGDCAAHFSLGGIYQKKGLIDLALEEYRQALKIQPGNQQILQAIDEIKQGN